MIMDELLEFGTAVDVSGTGTTTLVTDQIDLGTGGGNPQDLGTGEPLYLTIVVTTAFSGGTSVEFELVSDAAAAIATDGSASEHVSSGAIPVAQLTAGKTIVLALPAGGGAQAYERYLGVLATTVGAVSAGSISAFLTKDPTYWKSYADGQN